MKKMYTYPPEKKLYFRRNWSVVLLACLVTGLLASVPEFVFSGKKTAYLFTNKTRVLESGQVLSFNLINSDTDQAIQPIPDGAVLNLATLPSKKLNIQAVTNPETIGSVVFHLAGPVIRNHTENAAPYALFSERGGNYAAWIPSLGNYTLIATPYSGRNGSGIAGIPSIITFTIINKPQYNLTITSTDSGYVTINPDRTIFLAGDSVTLTATPKAGFQFNGWSGSATGRTNPLTVVMNRNKNITANFRPLEQAGALVSYVLAQSPRIYELSELKPGVKLYTDRTYEVTTVPDYLNGAPFIKTPNDDKGNKSPEVLSFELNHEAKVYIAYDPLARALPGWMKGWQKHPESIGITDPRISHLALYSKVFPAGPVKLGGNLARPAIGSKNTYIVVVQPPEALRPSVTAVRPANGTLNVPLDQSVSVDLQYPSGRSINGNTVNPNTVKLFTVVADNLLIPVDSTAVNSTAAGDAITLSATLKPGTTYEFLITDQVEDGFGNRMIPFTSRFKTTDSIGDTPTDLSGVSFTEQTLIDNTFGQDGFTSLVIGPDRRFYATTSGGKIERWDLNPDGSITNHITIAPFDSTRRLLIGFKFDPAASATNLVAWMSHSSAAFNNVPDWTGKISQVNLTDPAHPVVTDYVINLPRSYKDHATNGITFGPDGALYFPQGSHTAMGFPDAAWGHRPERLLTATILRLDIGLAQQLTLPLDVKTEEGGTYNPYAFNAPLTIFATGVRNAYDLVWHSNGELYVPTNGSAAGGNTLELKSGTIWSNGQVYTGPDIPSMIDVRDTQNDYLFRVEKGGYYGHPNPLRNEYILNGGNPTNNLDPGEVVWNVDGLSYGYPVGTPTEPTYRGWAYDFGLNKSPNGIIEYKSNAFGNKLKGKLLVCRFSGGDDVMVLEPGTATKNIIQATEGIKIPGLRRPFSNPLTLIEDEKTGNLYLSEYYDGNGDGKPRITLLKADQPATGEPQPIAATKNGIVEENKLPEKDEAGVQLAVYPNPNGGDKVYVQIKNFSPKEQVALTLHDLTGRLIQSKTVGTNQQGTGLSEISLGQPLKSGLYIIQAAGTSGKKQVKLVIR